MKTLLISLLFILGLAIGSPAFAGPYTNASLTATVVLVSARTSPSTPILISYNISNPNSSLVYVQFFDSATTGAVTLGTTAPLFWVAVPATNGVVDTAGLNIPFANGICIAVTTTPTGDTAASDNCPISLFFK